MAKPTIILLDDDKTVLSSVVNQLKRRFGFKFRYEQTEHKDEAWQVIESKGAENIGLVISDWVLPGQTGDRFLEELYQKHPNIGQIMLSGFADEASIEEARKKARIDYFIRKPWEESELIEAVERVMQVEA